MNRRKFFAGLALVPALPVAAATAATSDVGHLDNLATKDDIDRIWDSMLLKQRLAEMDILRLRSEIVSGRITPDTARALRA